MEITIEKGDGSTFSAEAGGDQRKSATIQVLKKSAVLIFYSTISRAVCSLDAALRILWIQIVIDGYSAPLTAGNFAKLVR